MPEKQDYKILVIDDEEYILDSYKHYLGDLDYTVFTAENGRIGLDLHAEHEPDLVIVDLRMPIVDGMDVLREIKKSTPDTPVIVVSGTGVISDVIEALRIGAWDYMLKPIEDLSVSGNW